ncbi:MAG: hypothetical protein U5Q44_07540 [Dehalococcoidia bacterium]|nr:hypothetical protein [Dehalococcoidia bacterium]
MPPAWHAAPTAMASTSSTSSSAACSKSSGSTAKPLGSSTSTWPSVDPAQATLDYTNFLVGTGLSSKATLGETLAALTPCMRLYAFLGQSLAQEKPRPAEPLYAEWVDTYASEDFEGLASTLERLLDRYGRGSDRERQNYQRAMELEHAFFDAAWNAGA